MGNQTELEYKFDAEDVYLRPFLDVLMAQWPTSYEDRKPFDDIYYQRGSNVVRHRLARGGELTVKERKSADSILDRVEINLTFSKDTDQGDVEAFLKATGYKKIFTLRKNYVQIFTFVREDYEIEVCRYSVSRVDEWGGSNFRKFIEAEIKRRPGSDYTDSQLKGALKAWRQFLQLKFNLGDPLNESLLEIYSKLTSPSSVDVPTHYRI